LYAFFFSFFFPGRVSHCKIQFPGSCPCSVARTPASGALTQSSLWGEALLPMTAHLLVAGLFFVPGARGPRGQHPTGRTRPRLTSGRCSTRGITAAVTGRASWCSYWDNPHFHGMGSHLHLMTSVMALVGDLWEGVWAPQLLLSQSAALRGAGVS